MSNTGQTLYKKLISHTKKSALLSSISSLLDWDQETGMPKEAGSIRAEEQGLISGLIHKEHTSKSFAKLLSSLIDLESGEIIHTHLNHEEVACLKNLRRDYLQQVKLPSSFVRKFAILTSEASHIWAEARKHNNFKQFAPHLTKIVDLCRKKADYLGHTKHPYDALMDLFEPMMTTERVSELFTKLRIPLSALLKSISVQKEPEDDFLSIYCDPREQMEFNKILLEKMGFSQGSSRLDITTHPFCSALYSKDIRMTTRIHPENIMSNIFSVLHEGGHGLYALGRSSEHWGTPLGDSCSLGIDESQSRMWETIIGKSLPFWKHFYPLLQKSFPLAFRNVDIHTFYKAINKVKPSFIRVEADEVCYCLHVIVRFEIEKALIEGSLKVKDLPEAWNDKMIEYLGILPKNDAEGCLQDIHWSMGSIGYFPTYALGNMYAAQFFEKFTKDHPNWDAKIESGDLSTVYNYYHKIIYQFGRQYSPEKLVIHATSAPLSEKPYINYLTKKFSALYGL